MVAVSASNMLCLRLLCVCFRFYVYVEDCFDFWCGLVLMCCLGWFDVWLLTDVYDLVVCCLCVQDVCSFVMVVCVFVRCVWWWTVRARLPTSTTRAQPTSV